MEYFTERQGSLGCLLHSGVGSCSCHQPRGLEKPQNQPSGLRKKNKPLEVSATQSLSRSHPQQQPRGLHKKQSHPHSTTRLSKTSSGLSRAAATKTVAYWVAEKATWLIVRLSWMAKKAKLSLLSKVTVAALTLGKLYVA